MGHTRPRFARQMPGLPVVLLLALLAPAPGLARLVQPHELLRDPAGAPGHVFAGHRLAEVKIDSAALLTFVAEKAPDGDAATRVVVRLDPAEPPGPAFERTPSFALSYLRPGPGGPSEDEAVAVTRAVAERVRANDPGGLALPLVASHDDGGAHLGAFPSLPTPRALVDEVALKLTLALVLAWLALMPWGLWRAVQDVLRPARGTRVDAAGWVVVVASLGGLALRLGLPCKLVLYYLGYEQAAIADTLTGIPKYGPAGFVLYHLLFQATGPSTAAMVEVTRVMGSLMPLLSAATLARLGAGRRPVALAALAVAFVPLFFRNAVTESLLVPMLAWLLLAVHAGLAWRAERDARDLAVAVVAALLSMLTRPETLGLGPLALALVVTLGPRSPRRRWLPLAGAAVTALVVLGVRLAQLWWRMGDEVALGNTPQITHMGVLDWALTLAWEGLVTRDSALWPRFFPVVPVTALALAAPAFATHRRTSLRLLGVAVPWLAASRLDLPYMSLPRVQEPGLLFLTLAAVLGADGLLTASLRLGRRAAMAVAALLLVATVAASAYTVPGLWERTTADDEEDLIALALPLLPTGAFVLARRGFDDAPAERLPLHFPDYEVPPPGRTIPLQQLLDTGVQGPTYVWLGTRCFLRACSAGGEHPACAEVRRRFRLEPVLERDVPNRHLDIPPGFGFQEHVQPGMVADHDFPYCAVDGTVRVGLYRVVAEATSSPSQ